MKTPHNFLHFPTSLFFFWLLFLLECFIFMLPLFAAAFSALLAALTFLSWPSGPHPWLRLLTTSPTELQIGWHTMPQILKHQHNALTDHTPSLSFSLSPHTPTIHPFTTPPSFIFLNSFLQALQVHLFCTASFFLAAERRLV